MHSPPQTPRQLLLPEQQALALPGFFPKNIAPCSTVARGANRRQGPRTQAPVCCQPQPDEPPAAPGPAPKSSSV